jgi:hypothetical protein
MLFRNINKRPVNRKTALNRDSIARKLGIKTFKK